MCEALSDGRLSRKQISPNPCNILGLRRVGEKTATITRDIHYEKKIRRMGLKRNKDWCLI